MVSPTGGWSRKSMLEGWRGNVRERLLRRGLGLEDKFFNGVSIVTTGPPPISNSEHVRQSRLYSGLGVHVKILKPFKLFPLYSRGIVTCPLDPA